MITEGEVTEREYIDLLDQHLRSRGSAVFVKPVGLGKDPVTVVKRCIAVRDDHDKGDPELRYDDYVCLVDVDKHSGLDAAIKLAHDESIPLLISNLKFEVWLRWHVEDKTSSLSTGSLDTLMKTLGLMTGKHLANGFPLHGVDRACQTARRADPSLAAGRKGPDPSSAMPVLIDLLRGH